MADIAVNGFRIFYYGDPGLAGNAYLQGKGCWLLQGGMLAPTVRVSEPATWARLLGSIGVVLRRRRRRRMAGPAVSSAAPTQAG